MSSNTRTSASRLPLFSETNNFQDPDHALLTALNQAANFRRIQRVRFWLSTFIKVLILIGVFISLISLTRLWGDFQCRTQDLVPDHISIPLPCTPLDLMTRLEEVKRPATRDVWCSAPVVFVDPLEYDCSTLQAFGVSPCGERELVQRGSPIVLAWYTMVRPASLGTGLRIFYPEVQITYGFSFTCSKDEPKTPSSYSAPIIRSLVGRDSLLASYID